MRTDYGVPPLAEENQLLVEQRLREFRTAGGVLETVTVEWRGKALHVEVIDMPVEALYYNPGTHRIRAQRMHDSVRDEELIRDPWSARSQEYLDYLLKALPAEPSKPDPEFEVLLQSLREFKQTDPGLITRNGVLVNGNTRRAALKQLGVSNIRVGVLPETCTWDDVNAVELSLQLRRDHKRDYSYINELLAIDEQLTLGRPLDEIAKEFRRRADSCKQDMWILAQLRDLLERSASDDVKLRLMDFEDSKEKLRELHRRYDKDCKSGSRDHADLLKENRLAAIALDFSKTDIREIDHEFRDRYLVQSLPPSLKITMTPGPASVNIPGLNRSVKAAGADVAAAAALTDSILKAMAVKTASDRVPLTRSNAAEQFVSDVRLAFADAVDKAKQVSRIRKRRQAAPDRISDACQDLAQCVTDLVVARASNSLDEEAYDEAVQLLRGTLRKLALESSRSIEFPGEGVSWLLEVSGKGGNAS
ncbi:hypothetical protein GCM10022419_112670 [Nonomuraea rosea]|uniref:Transcriptional regulator n=1 Tax=Nonomuraea rosea TaxID=638574 RepID=A0ABP6ZJK6_9ACTN